MASSSSAIVFSLVIMFALTTTGFSQNRLSPTFYFKSCPKALSEIQRIVLDAVRKERRMGASLLRLHFHDCFVNGCDGSILLDDIPGNFTGEKTAFPNVNSVRGYDVIDRIKSAVDRVCGRGVVSCADILAVAARDSVYALGGPTWKVLLGRRDSTTASLNDANRNLPAPFLNQSQLLASFQSLGLNRRDLVALSGAHTIGFSQCQNFRNRIYNDTNIDPNFARIARQTCPRTGGNTNLRGLDSTPLNFDLNYFNNLQRKRGLLHSDQELFNGGRTDSLVRAYSRNPNLFAADFARSMTKMGNMKPLLGKTGQIRVNCRTVN